MDLLLKITTRPIEYNIHTEPASLSASLQPVVNRTQQSTPAKVNTTTKSAEMTMDFKKTYESIGLKRIDTFIKENGAEAMQASNEATSEYVKRGNSLSQIQTGMTVGDYFRNKHMSAIASTGNLSYEQIESPVINFEVFEPETNVTKAELEQNWNIEKNVMEFLPGKFQMDIISLAECDIEYIGGIHYVPPSADPDYGEPEAG